MQFLQVAEMVNEKAGRAIEERFARDLLFQPALEHKPVFPPRVALL